MDEEIKAALAQLTPRSAFAEIEKSLDDWGTSIETALAHLGEHTIGLAKRVAMLEAAVRQIQGRDQ